MNTDSSSTADVKAPTDYPIVPNDVRLIISRENISNYVAERIEKILGEDEYAGTSEVSDELDMNKTFLEIGFDSLMALDLKSSAKDDLGVDIPIASLFTATISKVVDTVLEEVNSDPYKANEFFNTDIEEFQI